MALIKCPECGTEISDKAESCPRCGYPITEEEGEFATLGWRKYFEGKSLEQIEEIKKRVGGGAGKLAISSSPEAIQKVPKKVQTRMGWGTGCFLLLIFFVLAILFNRPTPTPPKPTPATTEVRPAEEACKTRLTEINKTAIRTMIETHDYFIVELEDTGSIVRISLELRFKPLSEAQLRNLAIDVCKNAVAYLRNISFKDRSVSVWLQSRADRGFITLYGRAFYSPILGSIDWRPKRG